MSPFAIDEDRMATDPMKIKPGVQPLASLDPAKPPVKSIPHQEYPRVVYRHPKEAFRKIEHRNAHQELVHVETVPAEHLTKLVSDEKELKAALKDGWVKEPYVPEAPPDPNADLYADGEKSQKS
jgi:hypothetical protein